MNFCENEDDDLITQAEEMANTEKLVKEKKLEHAAEEEQFSDCDSESSSSEEDSDDDYEVEMNLNGKKRVKHQTDTSDDEETKSKYVLEAIERKIDQAEKKRRLEAKKQQKMKESDEEVICDFESNKVQQNRKRRLFRRKMLRSTVKRRRIKRTQVDVTEDYSCGTFLEFGATLSSLTTNMTSSDEEINYKALNKVFEEMGIDQKPCKLDVESSADEKSEYSEEDEADIIASNLKFYKSRNTRERIDQMNNLPINSFSEKLVNYSSQKSLFGGRSSSIRNYHPDSFIKNRLHKLPPAIIWKRPFTHLVYQKSVFDQNEEANDFLKKAEKERESEREKSVVEMVMARVAQKRMAREVKEEPEFDLFVDDESGANFEELLEYPDGFEELVMDDF